MSEEEIKEIIKDFLELREIHSSDSVRKSYLSIYQEAIQGLLDLYKQEKLNSFKLSEQLKKEKEKNKELENCLQMAKQIMTADISEDFDCMKLKEFKEYLLNEIKLNENFEE